MQIILLERVEKLGTIGDVVTVKDGYARNFLLPNKKALRANEANRKVFEANRAKIEADNANRRGDAEKHAANVEGKQIVLIRAASNTGQLYGSVSARDIVDALEADVRGGGGQVMSPSCGPAQVGPLVAVPVRGLGRLCQSLRGASTASKR